MSKNVIIVKIEDLEVCPHNPRKRDLDSESLGESVKKVGVTEVIEVHRHGKKYHIMAGQRRFLSAKKAGLKELECLEYPFDEQQAKEWCQRNASLQKSYHPLDLADLADSLIKQYGSIEKASKATGINRSFLKRYHRLVTLDEEVKAAISGSPRTMLSSVETLGKVASLPKEQQRKAYEAIQDKTRKQANKILNLKRERKVKLSIPKNVLPVTKTNTLNCDLHLHHYVGCSHGCLYCYCEWMSFVGHKTWLNASAVPNVTEILRGNIKTLKKKGIVPKGVMVSSSTDPYQPLNDKLDLTRKCLEILMEEGYRIVILTKSHRILKDIDLFKKYDNVVCGVTITTLDDYVRRRLETGSSSSKELVNALKTLHEEDIKTYCSVEPILLGSNPVAVVEKIKDYVDFIEFGKLNPVGDRCLLYYERMFRSMIGYCKEHHINYGIAVHSKPFCESHNIPFKTCCV